MWLITNITFSELSFPSPMASANRCFCHHLNRCVNVPKPSLSPRMKNTCSLSPLNSRVSVAVLMRVVWAGCCMSFHLSGDPLVPVSLLSLGRCSVRSPHSRSLFPYSAVVGEAAQPVMAFLHTALAIILVRVFKYSEWLPLAVLMFKKALPGLVFLLWIFFFFFTVFLLVKELV